MKSHPQKWSVPETETHGAIEIARYDDLIPGIVPYHSAFLGTIIEYLPENPKYILELGSGTGFVTAMIRAAWPESEITCIDISPGMLDYARQNPKLQGVRLVHGDLRDAWPSETYDAILTTLCLHHVGAGDRTGILSRAVHALAPGGRFICGDVFRPRESWQEDIIREYWRRYMEMQHVPDDVVRRMLRQREGHFAEMDTIQTFCDRMSEGGFVRVASPFTSGFLGVVVGFC